MPDDVRARDYCGSLVNVITAYALLEEIAAAGHRALAHSRNLPAMLLVRTDGAREALCRLGAEHIIVTREGFTDTLSVLSAQLGTTAVFDGVGGDLLTTIAPVLAMNSTIYLYAFSAEPRRCPFSPYSS